MGERLIENCHLYFTDLNGEPVDLGEIGEIAGKIEETTNNISLSYDEENPPTFNMIIPEDTSLTLEVNDEGLRDKLIEIFETTSAAPVTIEEDNSKVPLDSLDSLTYAIEEANRLTKKCINSLEKFAESSKIVYNKEKEKKGEEMDRTVAIVRFWDQKQNKLGTKDYYYFYNPISGHACFNDLQRKYWIKNDTGRVYENPVVFKGLVPESRLLKENLQKITKTIIEVEPFKEMINVKGDNRMNFNKIFPDAYIGQADGVKMSIYGPAFRSGDTRDIAFKDGEWIDVTGFTFDFLPAFVCPVKASDITVGDFIRHMGSWCRVISIDDTTITAEKVYVREIITIVPVKSMFGFDFYSKLIIPFGDITDNIGDVFANPLMTMMLFGGDSKDFNNLLPLMLMSGGKFDMSNPTMLYFLMKGSNGDKTGGINFDIGF